MQSLAANQRCLAGASTSARSASVSYAVHSSLSVPRHSVAALASGRFVQQGPSSSQRVPQAQVCYAKKRAIQGVDDFPELFMSVEQKGMELGFLPKMETYILVESVRSAEQAQRLLKLFAAVLQLRVQMSASVDSDWHIRKGWYTRLVEVALFRIRQPALAYELVRNHKVFGISKYFCADLIETLGKRNETEDDVMVQLVELNRAAREPGCKGVKRAYMELLEVHQRRKDEELLSATRANLKAWLATTPVPAAAAGTPPSAPATMAVAAA